MSTDDEKIHRQAMIKKMRIGGVTLERLEEIEEAEKEGREIEITDEERAAVEQAREEMKEISQRILKAYDIGTQGMFAKLDTVINSNPILRGSSILPDMPKIAPAPVMRFSETHEKMLKAQADARREEDERETLNSQNIQLTAEVMREMLERMTAEAANADKRDQAAAKTAERHHRESSKAAQRRDYDATKAAKTNLGFVVASTLLAAMAVVAPFIIEAIKGWK